jgi:hypothetical protein
VALKLASKCSEISRLVDMQLSEVFWELEYFGKRHILVLVLVKVLLGVPYIHNGHAI